MTAATPIKVYRAGRKLPIRSKWRRTSSVAEPDTLLHRGDRVIEADGRHWRVTGFAKGCVVLKPER